MPNIMEQMMYIQREGPTQETLIEFKRTVHEYHTAHLISKHTCDILLSYIEELEDSVGQNEPD